MKAAYLLFSLVASVAALAKDGLTPRVSFEYLGGRSWDIFSQLASELSPGASIILPDNPRFQTVHQRWQGYSEAKPTYAAVVEVAVEDDVAQTVRWANKHSLPFLAVGGAHGFLKTLGRMQGGIAISFIKMKGIEINPRGDSAELQPGLTNGELVRYLWPRGKQTVTGNCLCSGVMGIMLGGGHGYLQGLYGLLADQIEEARVVLADGESVIASQQTNPDLFWALRGAGHNFGIVTGFKYKIYDRIPEWTVFTMFFTQDKLEEVFTLANNYLEEKDHPAELIFWHTFVRRPDLDPNSAVIVMSFIYGGGPEGLDKFAAPFRALKPAAEQQLIRAAYPDVFDFLRNNESSVAICAKGWNRQLWPNYLKSHNPTALRRVHTIFNSVTTKYPAMANISVFALEGYSLQAVTKVPADSTATPFREYPILASPLWAYMDPSYTDDVIAASKEISETLIEGSGSNKRRAYVNTIFGDEPLPEIYGYEPWRLQKLKALKKKYDPEGRFNFYAPIDGELED